jgi:4-amino-4-deoxy-L-arabinose transferase-like glycosyltransferase
MPLAPRRPQTFVIVAGLLSVAAAIWYANETGASLRGLLGFPSRWVDGVVAIGAALHALTAQWIQWLRAALLLPVAAYVWNAARHPEMGQGRGAGASALCVALVGQSFLVEGRLAAGLTAYAAAAIIYLARPLDRRAGEEAPPAGPWRWRESLIAILLLAGFLSSAVYGLDLLPIPDFDELGFAMAARMQAGEIPEGRVLGYDLKRFQALPLPLFLQALAVRYLHPGLLSIRLVMMAAGALALLVAAIGFRRTTGSRAVLWMLALAAFSPVYLHYARWGHYMMVSVLHGVVTLALLITFVERWGTAWALALGLAIGTSIHCYQVSWFAPIIAGACLLAVPALRNRAGFGARLATIGALGLVIMLPAFTFRYDELRAVNAETFDSRSVWYNLIHGDYQHTFITAEKATSPEDAAVLRRELEARGLRVFVRAGSPDRRTRLIVTGDPAAVRAARVAVEKAAWTIREDISRWATPWGRAAGVLRSLYAPGAELFNPIHAPLLHPISACLLVLGLLHGVRHWRVPAIRILVIWVVCAAFLPSIFGGAFYRRTVLMFPGAFALMGLALEELSRDLRSMGRLARAGTPVVAGILLTVVTVTNVYSYHRLWNPTFAPDNPSMLLLGKIVLASLPSGRVLIAVPKERTGGPFPGLYLQWIAGNPRDGSPRVVQFQRPLTPAKVQRLSCAQRTPFVWVIDRAEEHAPAFTNLTRTFDYESTTRGPYRIYAVTNPRPGTCPDAT